MRRGVESEINVTPSGVTQNKRGYKHGEKHIKTHPFDTDTRICCIHLWSVPARKDAAPGPRVAVKAWSWVRIRYL